MGLVAKNSAGMSADPKRQSLFVDRHAGRFPTSGQCPLDQSDRPASSSLRAAIEDGRGLEFLSVRNPASCGRGITASSSKSAATVRPSSPRVKLRRERGGESERRNLPGRLLVAHAGSKTSPNHLSTHRAGRKGLHVAVFPGRERHQAPTGWSGQTAESLRFRKVEGDYSFDS